jgi:hypothetical protein
MILSRSVKKTYPSGHVGGGGSSEVASAGDAGIDLAGAADGGNEVSQEDVGGEEMVLGAGAGDVGVDILGLPVAAKRVVQGESVARRWCLELELGWNDLEFQLAVLSVVEGGR